MIGKTISHFKILEKLGEGGMGVVYKAEDTSLGRSVALKFLSSEGTGSDEDHARFLREARAAAALDHPNICPVHEIGEAEGQAFIAMACLEGATLKERIAAGPIALREILDIAAQVADGLAAAHEKGIVHRDIKPANLMLTREGRVKIMDFGLARLAEATRLTRPGAALGTIAYMSPEQARAEDVDHRADIWSLGVVVYEMITGQRPFGGADSRAVAHAIMNDRPLTLTSLRPDVPSDVEELVRRCLAKEPGERFQTARELAAALRRIEVAEPGPEATAVQADAATVSQEARAPSDLPHEIAGYKILERLGEGGMGMVYLAEQQKPVRRRVALKVIKLGMDTKEVIARFESERQALAMMSHPNIARIFDAGSTEEGRPYFAMEYVPGETITEYCDKHRLSIRERLGLFADVCRAIHHAHQKGIIHRDIKPSNILVMIQDDKPVPKIIDFGVAKATTQRLTERTVFTEFGELVGTPEYMSPEQLEMTGLDVDTTTDVYSLGVLLYELLVGGLPFESKTLREAGWDGLRQLIREVDPPRPSTRVGDGADRAAQAAARRQTDSEALRRSIRGELDWITMRALEKDRTRRYQSASEFAADIERYLSDEPVQASPPSNAYRLGKFVRRHRTAVTAAVALAATIVTLGSVAMWQGRVAQQRAALVWANGILASAAATDDPLLKALLVLELADVPDLPGRLTIAREAADHALPITSFKADDTALWAFAFSPDGSRFATGSRSGLVRVWRSDGTGEPAVLRGHEWGIWDLAFSVDGTHIFTASEDSTARMWRADGLGEPLVLGRFTAVVWSVAASPDGRVVAAAPADSTVRIWPSDGQGDPITLRFDAVTRVIDFSPDGSRLVTGSYDGVARVWTLDDLREPIVLSGHESYLTGADFSPDGTLVVTASSDGTARIWRSDGTGQPVVLEHGTWIGAPEFGPDGSWIATNDDRGVVRVWPSDGEGEPAVLEGHEGWLNWMEVSPDGQWIATAGRDGTSRLWRIDGTGEPTILSSQDVEVMASAFSPDGSMVFTTSGDGCVKAWRVNDSGEATVVPKKGIWSMDFSPDGSHIVTGAYGGTVHVWATDGTGAPLTVGTHPAPVFDAGFSPDGSLIMSAARDSAVRIWQADGGGEVAAFDVPGRWPGASFSPDGTQIVTASRDGKIVVRPVDGSGDSILVSDLDTQAFFPIFTPDGRHVIAGADDNKVRMWPVEGTGEVRVLAEHKGLWGRVALSSDGRLLATTSYVDNTARIWALGTADPPIILRGHSNEVSAAVFSRDDKRIVTTSLDSTVRVWDVETGLELLTIRVNNEALGTAVFSPDGTRLAVFDTDDQVRILRVTWHELEAYLRRNAGGCLTPEQRTRYLGESAAEAWEAYAEYERGQGREPVIERPD
jgi:serine/threonine protein kinase/WD40 repeat protein